MDRITLTKGRDYSAYTDGSCFNGEGGWGAIIIEDGKEIKALKGLQQKTTNNRMEIKAVMEVMKVFQHKDINVLIYSDSQYVVNSINQWLENWIRRRKKNVKNMDLWSEVLILKKSTLFKLKWIRGHNGNVHNERADELASYNQQTKPPVKKKKAKPVSIPTPSEEHAMMLVEDMGEHCYTDENGNFKLSHNLAIDIISKWSEYLINN